eukprot:3708637-Pleurochrysis_carterae.AAC.1
MDVEPKATGRLEISAALSLHCGHNTREACQEPIMTLRGLSVSGVERYFADWQMEPNLSTANTSVWMESSSEALHQKLMKKTWHKWSLGCGKLHVKSGQS